MGGGKKGEPGEGKGEEEMDNLLTAMVSEGVVSVGDNEWHVKKSDCELYEPFVSGLITAEVMIGVYALLGTTLSASCYYQDDTAFDPPLYRGDPLTVVMDTPRGPRLPYQVSLSLSYDITTHLIPPCWLLS